jgi:hypothetical protein
MDAMRSARRSDFDEMRFSVYIPEGEYNIYDLFQFILESIRKIDMDSESCNSSLSEFSMALSNAEF